MYNTSHLTVCYVAVKLVGIFSGTEILHPQMVGNPFTFPTALPLKGDINLLDEQGRATSLVISLLLFLLELSWDPMSLGKMEDTKISLRSGIYKHSDLLKVCFAGYHLIKIEFWSEQACDVKHVKTQCVCSILLK